MCVQNLSRRKSRTLLTVLGVVIGCCSIVIMISIGIGMKVSQEAMLKEMGDLTIIDVSAPSNGRRGAKLNKNAMAEMEKIPGVISASPKLTAEGATFKLYAGADKRYVAEYASIAAFRKSEIEKLGFTLTEGNFSGGDDEVLAGQLLAYSFTDSLRPEGANRIDPYANMFSDDGLASDVDMFSGENMPEPYFNILSVPLTLEVSVNNKTISIPLKASGRLKQDMNKGWETAEGLIMDISQLEKLLSDVGVSNQSGSTGGFKSALVKVTDISTVAKVEQEIKKLGFNTQSMESIRKPMEKEARQKQMMLGGLGAISLLVAAIGITNTMIMSISERTKEIGIMKALGCYVRDIRVIFLGEAAIIGLLGGVCGSIISVIVSLIMNFTSKGNALSIIPFWLIAFAIVFSISIGLVSGYYPANKAVKIPALEAIKSE